MEPFFRIGMFVKRGAVETTQSVIVGRKMPRHPIQDHPHTAAMRGIDKGREFLGATMADGRRIKPDRLIAPGSVKGKFGYRQKLDMREPHLDNIIDQLSGEFLIAQRASPLIPDPSPGPEMHLINRNRRMNVLHLLALPDPGAVAPQMQPKLAHLRRRLRRMLGAEADRIGLERLNDTIGRQDFIFVDLARHQAGHEDFPNPRRAAAAHLMPATVPDVEIADDGHPSRRGRPDRKMHAADALVPDHMRAQNLPQTAVRPFSDQIFVDFAKHRTKRIGIFEIPGRLRIASAQTISFAFPFS